MGDVDGIAARVVETRDGIVFRNVNNRSKANNQIVAADIVRYLWKEMAEWEA